MLGPGDNELFGDYQKRVAAAINTLETNFAVLGGRVAELERNMDKLNKLLIELEKKMRRNYG